MFPPIEKWLRWNLRAVFFTYLLVFGVLGFFIGPWDYDHLSAYYEIAWRFWRHAPGLPEYNPFLCGGRTLGADPQIPIFSPIVLLVGLVGPTWTIKLELLVQLALGSLGLWKLLEQLGVDKKGRHWGLFLFVSGGAVVARYLVGHVTLGFFTLLPLFLSLSYRLQESRGPQTVRLFATYATLFAYSALYKPNFVINGVLILGFEALVRTALKRSVKPLVGLGLAATLGICAAAPTYLPSNRYFKEVPRTMDAPTIALPQTFLANFILPLKTLPRIFYGARDRARHETNYYVGVVALVFAASALRRRKNAELKALLATGVFFAWMGFGWSDTSSWSWLMPSSLLKLFWPGFSSIRVPERFWFATYLTLIVFSAVGFSLPKKRGWAWTVVLLGILPGTLVVLANLSKVIGKGEKTQWTGERVYSADFSQVTGGPDDTFLPVRSGQGIIDCLYNVETHTGSEIHPGRLLEAKAPPGVTVNARWDGWNAIHLELDNAYPVRVSFNLNHSPYWTWEKSAGDAKIVSQFKEPLSVYSPEPQLKGRLVFRQPLVAESVALAGGALLLLLTLWAYGFSGLLRRR